MPILCFPRVMWFRFLTYFPYLIIYSFLQSMQYKFKNLHNDRSNVHIELHSFEQVPRYPFYHHLSHATKSEILLKRFLGPVMNQETQSLIQF